MARKQTDQTTITSNGTEPEDRPDYVCPEYGIMKPRWDFVTMMRNVNEAIRTASKAILPKFDSESQKKYETRVSISFGFPAYDETVGSLVGLATKQPPVLSDDVPERLVNECKDVDAEGTPLDVFAQDCLETAIDLGHGAILVDHMPAPKEGMRADEEAAHGLRAYMVLVPANRIESWDEGMVLGRRCLTMVKFREPKVAKKGRFGKKTVMRRRVLRQEVTPEGVPYVAFEVWEDKGSGTGNVSSWSLAEEGVLKNRQWISFFPFYGGRKTGTLTSLPPMLGLAYTNLEHTQISSERRWSEFKTALSVPWFKGLDEKDGKVVLGDEGLRLKGAEAACGYLEPSGNALASQREHLLDLVTQMGSQGFAMLRREAAPKTATESDLMAAREESKLSRAVGSVERALQQALGAMADFYGIEMTGTVTMDREFADVWISDEQFRLLCDMEDRGQLTIRTLLTVLRGKVRALKGIDIKAEVDELERQRDNEPLGGEGEEKLPKEPEKIAA